MLERYPTVLVVDLKQFLDLYSDLPFFSRVGGLINIREFANTLLSINQHKDYEQDVYSLIDKRLSNHPKILNSIDMDVFDMTIESLATNLDDYIKNKLPRYIDTSEFILDRWLNKSTVILKYDETSLNLRHCRQNGISEFAFFRNWSPY